MSHTNEQRRRYCEQIEIAMEEPTVASENPSAEETVAEQIFGDDEPDDVSHIWH